MNYLLFSYCATFMLKKYISVYHIICVLCNMYSCIYGYVNKYINIECFCLLYVGVTLVPMCTNEEEYMQSVLQESCAVAKMTAQCALYAGAVKIWGTPCLQLANVDCRHKRKEQRPA